MATFGITPVSDFPPQTDDGFPNFIQFQDEGTALGGADAEVVDFTGAGVTATRGTGENANKVTVDIPGGGSAPSFSWNTVSPDTTYNLSASDLNNGVRTNSSVSYSATLNVGTDAGMGLTPSDTGSILLAAGGSGAVTVTASGGVTLQIRTGLSAQLAGRYAAASLIRIGVDTWLLAGDLAAG
jgi:hypothetical protein